PQEVVGPETPGGRIDPVVATELDRQVACALTGVADVRRAPTVHRHEDRCDLVLEIELTFEPARVLRQLRQGCDRLSEVRGGLEHGGPRPGALSRRFPGVRGLLELTRPAAGGPDQTGPPRRDP